MKVVDPHLHLWNTREVSYPWLAHAGVAYSGDNRLLPQPFDVQALRAAAGDIEVLKSVNVEANPADAVAEARWLQAQADAPANNGHPHGIVACADLSQKTTPALFEQLSAYPNLRGIRQILNVHHNKQYDYVGRHYLREPAWRDNLRCLSRYGWSFDLQIYPSQASDAVAVINDNPSTAFIVNHALMFVDRNTVGGWKQWRDGLRALAACDNVAIKLSGFAMFDHQWTVESFRPQVLEAIDAFGVERCMFASNFPIDGLHSSYAALWHAYAQIISGAAAHEREQLLVNNAIRWYRL